MPGFFFEDQHYNPDQLKEIGRGSVAKKKKQVFTPVLQVKQWTVGFLGQDVQLGLYWFITESAWSIHQGHSQPLLNLFPTYIL